MISKQQISKFESDGYIHIPNFFDENEIEIFSKAINIQKSLMEKYSINKTVDIEEVWEFINNTKMLSIIRSLLGDKIYYMHDADIISGSTNNGSLYTWHRDNPCRRTAVGPDWNVEEKYNVVSSAVYLTDSNSTLNVIKKSHLKNYKYSISNILRVIQLKLRNIKKFYFLKKIIEFLIGKHIKYGAGDLIIFYTTLYHTGSFTKNSENSYRDSIIARYGGEGSHMKNFLNYEMNYRKGIEKYEISTKKNIFFQKLKDNDIYISPKILKEKINGIFIPANKDKDSDSIYKK